MELTTHQTTNIQMTPINQVIKSLTSPITHQTTNNEELQKRRQEYKKELDEHKQRLHQQELNKIIQKSCLPTRYIKKNISDYIITNNNKQALNALNNSANSFYIYGDCGAGKTYLACLVAKDSASRSLKSLYFFTATNLIYILNPYKSNLLQEDKERQYSRHQIYNCGVLVIDDLGVENSNSFNQSILFDIINHRYNENLQTIITSNFEIKALQNRLSSYEGSRIGRRITEMCKPIFLKPFS